jgi:hypothetical protein
LRDIEKAVTAKRIAWWNNQPHRENSSIITPHTGNLTRKNNFVARR